MTNHYFINLTVDNAFNLSKTNILEIGPRMGALTSYILAKANKLVYV
ncbi:hypothetical protein [Spiroplasma endosymbiont of Polydrusus formosus]